MSGYQNRGPKLLNPVFTAVFVWVAVFFGGYLDFRIDIWGRYRDGHTVPTLLPIGIDFNAVYIFASALREGIDHFVAVVAPAGPNVYPPFVSVVMLPVTFFAPDTAYELYALLLVLFLASTAYLCLDFGRGLELQPRLILALLVTTVLFHSYPVNFSIERGNSDITAAFFMMLALWGMNRHRPVLAVIALTIATQFKVYPAVLAVLLLCSFSWKPFALFCVTNLALLFVLGIRGLENFFSLLSRFSAEPYVWTGNHSLHSWLRHAVNAGVLAPEMESPVRMAIFALLVAVFLLLSVLLLQRKADAVLAPGLDLGLIGMVGICFALMGLLPSTSHDYKLVIQFVPFLLLITVLAGNGVEFNTELTVIVAIIAMCNAWLFVPRYVPFWGKWLNPALFEFVQVKTPAILAIFFAYGYLAVRGAKLRRESLAGLNG